MSGLHCKWIALSNTTLGMLMATINASILLIALPDIFRGIGVNPLQPGNITRPVRSPVTRRMVSTVLPRGAWRSMPSAAFARRAPMTSSAE